MGHKKKVKERCFEVTYALGRLFFRHKLTPVLCYHSIDDSGTEISVTLSEFERQMNYMKENGFESISLQEYVKAIEYGKTMRPKSFVLTFDDGFLNNFSEVFPLLRLYGFRGTIFLATDYIGGQSGWIENGLMQRLKILTWSHVAEMSKGGMSFGAHTASHQHLTRLSDDEIREDILLSKRLIEDKIGAAITDFCYPWGDYDDRVVDIVKKCGFNSACSLDYGVKNTLDSLYRLKRLAIGPDTTLSYFKFIFSGFYDLNLARKRVLKAIKGRRRKHGLADVPTE